MKNGIIISNNEKNMEGMSYINIAYIFWKAKI